jgi:hypothetical protein
VNIDGFTQPGSAPGLPQIELNGSDMEGLGVSGLTIAGDGSTVRGLVINGFPGPGITVTSSGSSIRGNFIGTDLSGEEPRPNAQGIFLGSGATGTTIGGDVPDDRNVIGGNAEFGVIIEGSGNIVRGNVIGVDPEVIGAPNGSPGAPNSAAIMLLGGAANNYIGGRELPGQAAPNIIGFNVGRGVVLSNGGIAGVGPAGTGNAIGVNVILDNTGLGIDLGSDGVTPNDADDEDTGPNDFQNWPAVTSAVQGPGGTIVSGRLSSLPNSRFRIRVFENSSCDPSGSGEGQTHLGSFLVFTNADGIGDFATTFDGGAVGSFVTAIASTLDEAEINPRELDSSEFSPCRVVVDGFPPEGFEKIWVGGSAIAPRRWSLATNWSPMGAPVNTDDVFIQSTPDQPLVDAVGAVARNLRLGLGSTLELTVPGPTALVALTAGGFVDAQNGSIFGGATLRMTGSEVSIRGNLGNVLIEGQSIPNGAISASGIRIGGAFGFMSVGDFFVSTTNLTTEAGGVLGMSGDGGVLQTVNATFGGDSTSGNLISGELRILGNFTQLSTTSTTSFDASGTHLTRFLSKDDPSISFQSPGSVEGSHFNRLQLDVIDIQLLSNVVATGQLMTSAVAADVIGNGNTLAVTGLNVDGLTLSNAHLSSINGTITRFDNVVFQDFTGALPQFNFSTLGNPSPFVFNNIQFDSAAEAGLFLNVFDTGGPELGTDVSLVGATPANPVTGCARTASGANASVRWNGTLCGGF